MSYYVRKFQASSWPDGDKTKYTGLNDLSSSAFSDLLKNGGDVSFWKIESFDDLKYAAAALLSKSKSKLSKSMKFFYLSDQDALNNGFHLTQNSEDADTILDDLKSNHFDACDLRYPSLGTFADVIAKKIDGADIKEVDSEDVYAVFADYVNKKKIELNAFSETIAKETKKYL